MKDMPTGRCGPQLYLLSEEGYKALRHIQTMLMQMGEVTYEEVQANGNMMLAISRAELCFIFQEIGMPIGEVLERLGSENAIRAQKRLWQ